MKPQIVVDSWQGKHNASDYTSRLENEGMYTDRSTICIVPTRGVIHAKVVQNWMGMMTPMNQKFTRMFIIGLEVGEAYEQSFNQILAHPDLNTWKYILTLEEDNMVPPDGLLRLYPAMDEGYDVVSGLYWTKGEGGQPMCYGNPKVFPVNFIPQIPAVDAITECNGLGMGFTLFKMDYLKALRSKITGPLFKTLQMYEPGKGGQCFTQDLYHFQKGRELGFKYACDSRVKVGHYDANTDIVW